MKYKVIDVVSDVQEVEVGTCELCFSTTEADVGNLILEDENQTRVEVPLSVYNYDHYSGLNLPNVVDFSAWLQEHDVPELTGDEDQRFYKLRDVISQYEIEKIFEQEIDDIEEALQENFDNVSRENGLKFTYGPNNYDQFLKLENYRYNVTIPKQSEALNILNTHYGAGDLEQHVMGNIKLVSDPEHLNTYTIYPVPCPAIYIDGDHYKIDLGHYSDVDPETLVDNIRTANIHLYSLESLVDVNTQTADEELKRQNFINPSEARKIFEKQGLMSNLTDSLKDLEEAELTK